MSNPADRRRAERVHLEEPIDAHVDVDDVVIIEVGLLGAKIEHNEPLPHDASRLSFFWRGEEITYEIRVAHTDDFDSTLGGKLFRSGLEFISPVGKSDHTLREMLVVQVQRLIETQKANARGERSDDGVMFVRQEVTDATPESQYIVLRYIDNKWERFTSSSSQQPKDGLTVSASLPDQEVEMLMEQFAKADATQRHLLKAMAEASIGIGK